MLKAQIQDDMKTAMKAGDKRRLGAVRLILAALKQKEVDELKELTDQDVLQILEKMVKQRRDSITQYEQASRADLAEQEAFEIGVIQAYMPAALGEAEVAALIDAAIAATGAKSMQDMGKVMAQVKPQVQGRADMGAVSAFVKAKLAG
jgi:hypothetical protein